MRCSPCLAETDKCDFNCSLQLAPGYLVRLDGSPALTSLDMVDPGLQRPESLELLRFFGLTNNPHDGIQGP